MQAAINYQRDLLSATEAAKLAGIEPSHLRVLISRGQFPLPVRTRPQLWRRETIEDWRASRRAPGTA